MKITLVTVGKIKEKYLEQAIEMCIRDRDKSFAGEDAVVIDVGINVDKEGNLCGDVDYDSLEGTASMATPVPGGVGAVTTSVLAKHLVRAAAKRRG